MRRAIAVISVLFAFAPLVAFGGGCTLGVDDFVVESSDAQTGPDSASSSDAAGPKESAPPPSDPCGDKTSCGTDCVDIRSDPQNCGGCGNVCGGDGRKCKDGKCSSGG